MKCSRKIITSLLLALNVCLVGVGHAYWTFFVSKEYGNDEITLGDVEGDREVCYLNEDTEGNRYTSIEAALAIANKNGSGTVYVYPKKENSALEPVYIKRDCVIKSGVTLTLPYSGTKYDSETDDTDLNSHSTELIMADSSTSNVQKYRVTQVIMNEGVTLTVESGAHLNVGGFLWARHVQLAGQTAGNYAEISLCKKASIVCDGGEINVFGYIKEYDVLNNSSHIDLKSGTLLCPLVIYDYQGGAATAGVLNIKNPNKLTPFSRFDLCNVQTKMIVNSTAFLKVKTALYVGGFKGIGANFYPTGSEDRTVTMIGNSTNKTILQLTSGTIEMKYTPAVKGITSIDYDSTKTLFSIKGTVTLGGFSLDVSGKKLNTEECFFPISWRLGFELEKGSQVTFNKKIKFMPGSTLRIKNGASLTISNNCIFYQSFEDNKEGMSHLYPSNLPAAKLICNGNLTVTSTGIFGGLVSTEENTGVVSYQNNVFSSSSPETKGKAPSAILAISWGKFDTRDITANAQYVSNSSNAVTNFSSMGTYKSQGNYFVKE